MTRDPFAPDDLDFDGPVEAVLPYEVRAEHHALLRAEVRRRSRARRFVIGVSVGVAAVAALVATVAIWHPAPTQNPTPSASVTLRCEGVDKSLERQVAVSTGDLSAKRQCLALLRPSGKWANFTSQVPMVCPLSDGVLLVTWLRADCLR